MLYRRGAPETFWTHLIIFPQNNNDYNYHYLIIFFLQKNHYYYNYLINFFGPHIKLCQQISSPLEKPVRVQKEVISL